MVVVRQLPAILRVVILRIIMPRWAMLFMWLIQVEHVASDKNTVPAM